MIKYGGDVKLIKDYFYMIFFFFKTSMLGANPKYGKVFVSSLTNSLVNLNTRIILKKTNPIFFKKKKKKNSP